MLLWDFLFLMKGKGGLSRGDKGMIKKKYIGTKTGQNLLTAVNEEAMSYIKYKWMLAEGVRKDYPPLMEFFNKIAHNEREHCEIWAEEVYQKKTALEDLMAAIDREVSEGLDTYGEYAKTAREEGFEEIAKKFDMAACIERSHAIQLGEVAKALSDGTVYHSTEEMVWTCMECGNKVVGTIPPVRCPMCSHMNTYIRHTPIEQQI